MAGEIVVFLGPSLPAEEARRILDARYLSPVQCGDVLRVRRLKPRVIAIIDGLFESVAAVWHKEILLALDDGIEVFGASSMGALRAAELAPFGMVGVGRIFEAYRDGLYTDDDEVALLHRPASHGYTPVSEAMVNIRATVAKAIAEGVIIAESGERLIQCAKKTFYQERSIDDAIVHSWGPNARGDEPTRFRRFIQQGGYVNQKRLDALALVHHLAGRDSIPQQSGRIATKAHRTSIILKLQHEVMCGPFCVADTDLPHPERVAMEAAQREPNYNLYQRLAKLMAVTHALARAQGLTATSTGAGSDVVVDDFGLGPAARTRRWCTAQDLDDSARAELLDRLSVIRAFLATSEVSGPWTKVRQRIDGYLLTLMRIDGQYALWRPPGAGPTVDAAVLRNAALGNGAQFGLYRRIARLWSALDRVVVRHRVEPVDALQVQSDNFRRARGLERRDATLAWRRANNLDSNANTALLRKHARLSILCECTAASTLPLSHLADPACWLLDALRLTGQYAVLKRRAGSGVDHKV